MNEVNLTRIKLLSVFLLSNILLFYKEALYLNIILFSIILFYISLNKKLSAFISWLKPLFVISIIIFIIQREPLSSLRILSLSSLVFLFINTTELGLIMKALSFLPKQISYILSLSFGMIPQLSKEVKQITIAQQARGHKMNWNIFKSYLPVILPLFIKSFIRAEQISISMQARGFDYSEK